MHLHTYLRTIVLERQSTYYMLWHVEIEDKKLQMLIYKVHPRVLHSAEKQISTRDIIIFTQEIYNIASRKFSVRAAFSCDVF